MDRVEVEDMRLQALRDHLRGAPEALEAPVALLGPLEGLDLGAAAAAVAPVALAGAQGEWLRNLD